MKAVSKLVIGLVVSVFAAQTVSAGSLTGTISFDGKRPKRKKIRMNADPFCKSAHKKSVRNDEIIIKKKKVQNVFVYVKSGLSAAQKSSSPKPASVEMDQVGCLYAPKVLGMVAGQEILIKNSDSTLHNVNAGPTANEKFNQAMPTKGGKITKTFAKPEIGIKFKCDVHPWMAGYVNVLDHGYFAVTDKKGNFEIKGLPDGEYTVAAWHSKLGEREAKVKVAGSGKAEMTFTK